MSVFERTGFRPSVITSCLVNQLRPALSLPAGTYVKLQPMTSDFLDISNPKAVLERSLRSYSCLTKGDCFVVNYNNKKYEIEVRETKPNDAISVIETDCEVDFVAPKVRRNETARLCCILSTRPFRCWFDGAGITCPFMSSKNTTCDGYSTV